LVAGTATVTAGEHRREITLIGSTRDMLEVRHLRMSTGRYLPREGLEGAVCVLGTKVRRDLFPGANPLGEIVRIGDWRFRVIGVIAPRGMSLGMDLDEVVHVPAKTAMRLFDRSSLFRILAEVRTHGDMEAARADAKEVLRERHGEEDVTILTQDSVLTGFNNILSALTAALAGIAGVSLAVAGIGIMNVMLVTVSERTREIGLLKALGVTSTQVVLVFLLEAAILSTTGGVLGLLAGAGGSALMEYLYPEFPFAPPAWSMAAALGVSGMVGLVFGILPARNAARLDPVRALMRRKA
jgi:putative ABC transport system permease protein